jgi:hypothetical protein
MTPETYVCSGDSARFYSADGDYLVLARDVPAGAPAAEHPDEHGHGPAVLGAEDLPDRGLVDGHRASVLRFLLERAHLDRRGAGLRGLGRCTWTGPG